MDRSFVALRFNTQINITLGGRMGNERDKNETAVVTPYVTLQVTK